MEFICRRCEARFRAEVLLPLAASVRLGCPACRHEMVLRPARPMRRRVAIVADEPRPFRDFLVEQLRRLAFDVTVVDSGEPVVELVRRNGAELAIVNVYLRGKLGVEVAELIKKDRELTSTRVVLIGALFRANRFRANPTNLYGADEYIEEQIPEKEFRQIVARLFPATPGGDIRLEGREEEEARRLARLILSDIIIYHPQTVEEGLRNNNFFDILRTEIEEGRQYYESRVPFRIRQDTEIFTDTLQQFVNMKRDEIVCGDGRPRPSGRAGSPATTLDETRQ